MRLGEASKREELVQQSLYRLELINPNNPKVLAARLRYMLRQGDTAGAQQQLKKLSCAGIYQALRQLERAGLVAKFKLGDEQALYSFKNTQANIRICCRQCGRLEQIADPLFELQIQELILIHGASSYHLTLEKPKCFCCAENAAEQPDHPRR